MPTNIDATTIHTDEEMEDAILKYSVFGRVTPKAKAADGKASKAKWPYSSYDW